MKRLVAISLLMMFFFAGTLTNFAQERKSLPQEIAKRQVHELKQVLNLDDEQTIAVWKSLYAKEKEYAKYVSAKAEDDPAVQKMKIKLDEDLNRQLLEVLSKDQFKLYLKWLEKRSKEN